MRSSTRRVTCCKGKQTTLTLMKEQWHQYFRGNVIKHMGCASFMLSLPHESPCQQSRSTWLLGASLWPSGRFFHPDTQRGPRPSGWHPLKCWPSHFSISWLEGDTPDILVIWNNADNRGELGGEPGWTYFYCLWKWIQVCGKRVGDGRGWPKARPAARSVAVWAAGPLAAARPLGSSPSCAATGSGTEAPRSLSLRNRWSWSLAHVGLVVVTGAPGVVVPSDPLPKMQSWGYMCASLNKRVQLCKVRVSHKISTLFTQFRLFFLTSTLFLKFRLFLRRLLSQNVDFIHEI